MLIVTDVIQAVNNGGLLIKEEKPMRCSRIIAAILALGMTLPAFASAGISAQDIVGNGDVNDDKVFNISDIVMYQRWLGGKGELKNVDNGDVNGDGSYDVFDLCQMRKMLIKDAPEQKLSVSRNLCSGIAKSEVKGMAADDKFAAGQRKFATELLKAIDDGKNENIFISPYSVMQSLAMTTNGARGETLEQMEQVLGGVPIEELNEYLYLFRKKVGSSNKSVIETANSVWVRDDPSLIIPVPEFIQTNLNYYDADYYLSPFNGNTLKNVNEWVDENTRHYIPEIIDEIDPNEVFFIINAVVLDAEWANDYMRYQISNWEFTDVFGTEQTCKFMTCGADYIGDDDTDGFIKDYKDKNIGYAALLPHEDIDIHDYIKSLTSEKLDALLAQGENECEVALTSMPKYTLEYENDLKEELKAMGMEGAFEETANFTGLTSAPVPTWLHYVKHKTTLDVNEKGTKATAAAVTGGLAGSGMPPKEVYLTRPFVYCIYDRETRIPLFIGALLTIPEGSVVETANE